MYEGWDPEFDWQVRRTILVLLPFVSDGPIGQPPAVPTTPEDFQELLAADFFDDLSDNEWDALEAMGE